MAELVPAIHAFVDARKTWMPGTRPAMTEERIIFTFPIDLIPMTLYLAWVRSSEGALMRRYVGGIGHGACGLKGNAPFSSRAARGSARGQ